MSTRRLGRPSNKCLLSFVLVTEELSQSHEIASVLAGKYIDTPDYEYNNLVRIYNIPDKYAVNIMNKDVDSNKMLESEFNFQFIILNNQWISRLLSSNQDIQKMATGVLRMMLDEPKIGTTVATKARRKSERDSACNELFKTAGIAPPELSSLWALGARRGSKYEDILRVHFTGYNTTSGSGSTKRPDITLKDYTPCSILNAENGEASKIVEAIVRDYHAVEITTIKDANSRKVVDYLDDKIPNYIELLQSR